MTSHKKQILSKKNIIFSTIIKIGLILLFVFGYTQVHNTSFTNTIPLLAVNEASNNKIVGGSIVNLTLTITKGTGKTYVNLNTAEEVDTQISILNSQKIACTIFNLDCQNYDFSYQFDGSAFVLKGPSASSAIAILTAKTVQKQKLKPNTAITGTLGSGGLIGAVGGVNEKVKVAKELGITTVIIPTTSNVTLDGINIIRTMDLIEAYNNFGTEKYSLENTPLNKEMFANLMKDLAVQMCNRSITLKDQLVFNTTMINSSYYKQAQQSFNYSQTALANLNYYSQGSFCYNSNINYRILTENSEKKNNIDSKISDLKKQLIAKEQQLLSDNYTTTIKTQGDFYIYMILSDRLQEAKDFLKNVNSTSSPITLLLNTTKMNTTIPIKPVSTQDKIILYSYALERLYTVNLWENFLAHEGTPIKFTPETLDQACSRLSKELMMKQEVLKTYGITFFDKEVTDIFTLSQNPYSNKYLCLYKGLETTGKLNMILTSVGLDENDTSKILPQFIKFTSERIALHSQGNFPVIPYIYYEYSTELSHSKDISSALLYANYALAYTDLNLYVETQQPQTADVLNRAITQLYENPFFILGALLLIAFA